jgi:hypothetical protein
VKYICPLVYTSKCDDPCNHGKKEHEYRGSEGNVVECDQPCVSQYKMEAKVACLPVKEAKVWALRYQLGDRGHEDE